MAGFFHQVRVAEEIVSKLHNGQAMDEVIKDLYKQGHREKCRIMGMVTEDVQL